jgi:hypothetical protein
VEQNLIQLDQVSPGCERVLLESADPVSSSANKILDICLGSTGAPSARHASNVGRPSGTRAAMVQSGWN